MFGKASVLLVFGLALGGCGETHSMKSQGQTHWLVQCDGDSDCGELSCECGVCVQPCGSDGACSVGGVETQCFARGSGAVRALCGQEHEVPLCLEPCGGACGDGQSCRADACLPLAGPDSGMLGDGVGPDGSVHVGRDGGPVTGPDGSVMEVPFDAGVIVDGGAAPAPPTGTFTLGLRNESSSAVVLFVGDCNGDQRWFDLREHDQPLSITAAACDCRSPSYDPDFGCPAAPPVCQEPVFETLEPNAEKLYTWDTGHWFARMNTRCSYRWPVDDGGELVLRACWLGAMPADDNLRYPDDFTCGSRMFTLDSRSGSQIVVISD